jgi:pimeloyl-ACP methyl ester carboxylesterase
MTKLRQVKLCFFFCLLLFNTFSDVSYSHVIVIDGMHVKSVLYPLLPPDYTTYLRDAIDNYWSQLIKKEIGSIIPFAWSRNVYDTDDTVQILSKTLEETSKLCIQKGKPFVILAHSWGTVLAYLAIKDNPNIHVDKFITMGSPLKSQSLDVRYFTKYYAPNVSSLANVKLWKNYWSKCDPFSGNIPFLKENNIKISTDVFDIDISVICHGAYFNDAIAWKRILNDVLGGFTEEFNNIDAPHWSKNEYWSVVNGMFRAYNSAPTKQIPMISTYDYDYYHNITYEVSIKQDMTNPYGYATYVLFRCTPDFYCDWGDPLIARGTGYAFGIDDGKLPKYPYKRFYVYKVINGVVSTIKGWTASSAIKDTNQWNKLKVKASDKTFKLYINKKMIYQFTDDSIQKGRVGLVGYTGPYKGVIPTHYFDNISVTVP